MGKNSLGKWGEDISVRFLKRKGFEILERNFSCRFGEIDIIASNGEYLVFAEVKLRKNADFAEAKEFVDAGKQRRIIHTAMLWLSRSETELQPRFDVLEVYAPYGEKTLFPKINHIENAFE